MKARVAVPLLLVIAAAFFVWRAELFKVVRAGDRARPLAAKVAAERAAADLDLVLPAVPAGMQRLKAGGDVILIHYWAPWERHARDQAKGLDSLRREPELDGLRVVMVCFDPFPSVARYVARQRLRLAVLLDGKRALRRVLPCPSMPYTYVLDRSGRVAVAQPGEVDWWAPGTRAALRALLEEQPPRPRRDPMTIDERALRPNVRMFPLECSSFRADNVRSVQ